MIDEQLKKAKWTKGGPSPNPGGKRKQPDPIPEPGKTAAKQHHGFPPGVSGNPKGRPQGSRSRATLLAEALLDGQVEELTQKAIAMALGGDASVMRAVLDRLLPPRRERPVSIQMPKIETPKGLIDASSALMQSVADGEIAPGEAASLSTLIANVAQAISTADLAERIAKLEEVQAGQSGGSK
jgi:Family of unknown function (DUF5681)